MKPCFKNRKLIAWLALDTLDAESATALREHLANCDGCRGYLNELSKVTATLSEAEIRSDLQAKESFHRRVVAGIKAQKSRSVKEKIREFLRATLLDWRVAVPAVCGFAVVLLSSLLMISQKPSESPLQSSSSTQRSAEHIREADFAPTIGNYHMAANRSLESFDELLTEQAGKNVPSAPLYTASALTMRSVSD